MLLVIVLLLITATLLAILGFATLNVRRRQAQLLRKNEANQLQRRADHLFKIALATQVHTRQSEIAKVLLHEAIRVLDQSALLDPELVATTASLRECHTLLVSTEQEDRETANDRDPILEFPESELIEAQLHLTEASRLLISLEKRGSLAYEQLVAMQADIKQAQRALQLRLQLRQAAASANMERTVDQADDYLKPSERDITRLSH